MSKIITRFVNHRKACPLSRVIDTYDKRIYVACSRSIIHCTDVSEARLVTFTLINDMLLLWMPGRSLVTLLFAVYMTCQMLLHQLQPCMAFDLVLQHGEQQCACATVTSQVPGTQCCNFCKCSIYRNSTITPPVTIGLERPWKSCRLHCYCGALDNITPIVVTLALV